ncbi:MAG: DUF4286 family protein [Candidatus Rokubacteria bacterium]|nr:DUF4286 family protein [Candidatus Rokubacteria bacterium]
MPRPVILVVRATIAREHEASFNRWYEEEHIPGILTLPGVRAARRYRALPVNPGEQAGEDRWAYMTVYEFDSEAAYRAFMQSEHPAASPASTMRASVRSATGWPRLPAGLAVGGRLLSRHRPGFAAPRGCLDAPPRAW